jgi:Xaa-Pro dipeptidase
VSATGIHVGAAEHEARLARLREALERRELDAACLFGTVAIFYLSGFAYQPTERPVCLVVPRDAAPAIVLPDLEREHAELLAGLVPLARTYPEYPGERPPLEALAELLRDLGLERARLGADAAGYGGMYGSRSAPLAELCPDARVHSIRDELERLRSRKSAAELAAIRESARFETLAHRYLHERIRPGVSEIEVGQEASLAATRVVLAAFGGDYALNQWGAAPVHVGFKAGPATAWPHPMGGARPLARGDVIVTWATVTIDGYHAELERTLLLGEPDAARREAFGHMCALQEAGIAAIAPGRPCAEVDRAVRAEAERRGVAAALRHHAGHSLGLELHEPPYLDLGETSLCEPGMVLSVEPGLYLPGIGGFRHSDTVLVTETGSEVLSRYPRDFDALVIDA